MIKGALYTVIGVLGGFALRLFRFFFEVVLKGVVSVLIFFGLYIPFFHLVFALYLWLFSGFNPFDLSANSQLYLLGLGLSGGCAVIISVRNAVFKPAESVFKYVNVLKYKRRGEHYIPEQPEIYRSKLNPELIVYEYSDRFELYSEMNGRLYHRRTEPKRGRKNYNGNADGSGQLREG